MVLTPPEAALTVDAVAGGPTVRVPASLLDGAAHVVTVQLATAPGAGGVVIPSLDALEALAGPVEVDADGTPAALTPATTPATLRGWITTAAHLEVSYDSIDPQALRLEVLSVEVPPPAVVALAWPTTADVAESIGLLRTSPQDAAWLEASLTAALDYTLERSPYAWQLTDPAVPTPSLRQGVMMLAAHLFQRRATGTVAPDFGGDSFTPSLDPVITRLLGLGSFAPPRAV